MQYLLKLTNIVVGIITITLCTSWIGNEVNIAFAQSTTSYEICDGNIEQFPAPIFEFSNEGRVVHSNVPIFCAQPDEDRDGIYDPWELEAVRLLNPDIVLDEGEILLKKPYHHVVNFVRVTPLGDRYVLFIYAVAWTADYGRDYLFSHEGDVERIITAWEVIDGTTIELKQVFTSAHYGKSTDHSGVWPATGRSCNRGKVDGRAGKHDYTQQFCSDGFLYSNNRIKLYASEDKHAIYPRAQTCEAATLISLPLLPDIAEDCGGGGVHQFPAYNVGEPTNVGERDRSFLDQLSERAELSTIFPGEAIWDDSDGKFCGGPCGSSDVPGYIGKRLEEVPPALAEALGIDSNASLGRHLCPSSYLNLNVDHSYAPADFEHPDNSDPMAFKFWNKCKPPEAIVTADVELLACVKFVNGNGDVPDWEYAIIDDNVTVPEELHWHSIYPDDFESEHYRLQILTPWQIKITNKNLLYGKVAIRAKGKTDIGEELEAKTAIEWSCISRSNMDELLLRFAQAEAVVRYLVEQGLLDPGMPGLDLVDVSRRIPQGSIVLPRVSSPLMAEPNKVISRQPAPIFKQIAEDFYLVTSGKQVSAQRMRQLELFLTIPDFVVTTNNRQLHHGDVIALETQGDIPGNRWLDGHTQDGTVGLAPSTDGGYTGTRWQVFDEDNDGIVSLFNLGHIDGPKWLDGRTGDGTVGLAPSTEGTYTGTKWEVHYLENGEIALKCLGDIEGNRWLDGRTQDSTVGLAPNLETTFTGAKWKIYYR
jgi:hypothetical protein